MPNSGGRRRRTYRRAAVVINVFAPPLLLVVLLLLLVVRVVDALQLPLLPQRSRRPRSTRAFLPTTALSRSSDDGDNYGRWRWRPLRGHDEVLGHLLYQRRHHGQSSELRLSAPAAPTEDEEDQRHSAGAASSASSSDDDVTRQPLKDCVCLVTGASRGIGKGIAVALGKVGATVYVTGTSSTTTSTAKSQPVVVGPYATSDLVGGPGTIEETAQLVTQAGGHGVPVLCNHAVDEDVQHLFQRIQNDHGRLDILVNNVFRVPGGPDTLYGNFWEQGPAVWDCLHTIGLRSHYVASCYAVPLLLKSKQYWNKVQATDNQTHHPQGLARPLIVMISSFGGLSYAFNVAYGVAKAGVDRLAKDMAVELTSNDICVVSLWPGVVATERTDMAVQSGDWDRYVKLPLDHCESPEFTGRAVVALALDKSNMKKTGSYQVVAELAEEYGFTDVNGQRPPSIRSLRFLVPAYGMTAEMRSKVPVNWIPNWKLPLWIMSQGSPPAPGE